MLDCLLLNKFSLRMVFKFKKKCYTLLLNCIVFSVNKNKKSLVGLLKTLSNRAHGLLPFNSFDRRLRRESDFAFSALAWPLAIVFLWLSSIRPPPPTQRLCSSTDNEWSRDGGSISWRIQFRSLAHTRTHTYTNIIITRWEIRNTYARNIVHRRQFIV